MVNSEIRLVVIGRQEIAREGLRRILVDQGFSVEASARHDLDFAGRGEDQHPHLIIVAADTVDEGVDICTIMRLALPDTRLVLLTSECDLDSISRAIAVGVDGYLTNTIPCDPLVGALKLVLMGEKIVPTQIVNALSDTYPQPRSGNGTMAQLDVNLSDREQVILQRLVCGEANKLISRRLAISEATVKVHVKAILRKLHVLNRTQAAIWAVNHGLVSDDDAVPFIGARSAPKAMDLVAPVL